MELVRRAWEASLRHDNEAALEMYDAEVEIEVSQEAGLDMPTAYRGLAGVREMYRNQLDAFAGFTPTVEEWIDAGDHVIAMMHTVARGRQSGVPVERHDAHVWTVRDGKLWRLRVYPSREDALKAVGVKE